MEFFRKRKKIIILVMSALCLAAAVITSNTDIRMSAVRNAAGFIIVPAQGALAAAARWSGERIDFFVSMNSLHEENKLLRDQNEELKLEINRLKRADTENQNLTGLLELDREYAQYQKTGVKIISKDPSDWYDAYTINKGSNGGLSVNMVALAPGGLMGIITECGPDYSVVRSIIDDRSSIASQCSRTGDMGFVKGDSILMREGLCSMEYIDAAAEILEGDEITTSPLSAYYPAGITIGRVTEIVTDPNGLTKRAVIRPTVSLYRLETLLIVTDPVYAETGAP